MKNVYEILVGEPTRRKTTKEAYA